VRIRAKLYAPITGFVFVLYASSWRRGSYLLLITLGAREIVIPLKWRRVAHDLDRVAEALHQTPQRIVDDITTGHIERMRAGEVW